jgi:uncharacterized coiled-coil protein SlyX
MSRNAELELAVNAQT